LMAAPLGPIPEFAVAAIGLCDRGSSLLASGTWWYTGFLTVVREALLLNAVTCFRVYRGKA